MSLVFTKGCCCLGSQCEHLDSELRPAHICPKCKKMFIRNVLSLTMNWMNSFVKYVQKQMHARVIVAHPWSSDKRCCITTRRKMKDTLQLLTVSK